MHVIIKVKKDTAQELLQLLKLTGFRPDPDHPVSIDCRMTTCVLKGVLDDSQIEDTRMIRAVESLCEDPAFIKPISIILPEIPCPPAFVVAEQELDDLIAVLPPPVPEEQASDPPAFVARQEPVVQKAVLPPPIPQAKSDPSKREFYKKTVVPIRSLDHLFDFSDEDAEMVL